MAIAFILLPLTVSTVGAQDNSSQLYEGLNVSAVDLVAQPSVNVGPLQPLVAQKANAPYSTQAVARTLAALRATGKFPSVREEVKPGTEGLRVTFLLEPVYYPGAINFPGAREFAYQRLLEIVNYPWQDPYEASRASAGVPLLTHFFAQQGYFAAQVKLATHFDNSQRLANLTYNVTLGPRAKFGVVSIMGPPPAEAEKLRRSLLSLRAFLHGARVNEGKTYDPARIQDATTFLQNYLGKQNYLANQVRHEPAVYDPETRRATVQWNVTLGETVTVDVVGAKLSRRTIRSLVPIYQENTFDQDLVEEGERNIISYYQGKGYDNAKVTPQTRRDTNQISLEYHVDRGPRRRVTSVRITGNRHFSKDALAGQIVVQKAQFFSHGKYDTEMVNQTVKNLKAFYENAGYAHVEVEPRVVERARDVDVTFHIREGELTLVESLNVVGNRTEPLAKLAPAGLILKPGQPYSQALQNKDRNHIIARYLDLGYPNATLDATAKPVPGRAHRVAVTYKIDEGPQVHIASVAVVGNKITRPWFVAHNVSVKAGEPLSEAQVLGSESSLYNLGIFDSVSIDPLTPITDQTSEPVLVRVHESQRNSLSYGLGLIYTPVAGSLSSGIVALPGLPTLGLPTSFKVIEKTVFSPLGSVEYSRLNLFGRAETASVSTFLSVLDQRGTVSYTDPQFRGLKWSSLFSVSAERSAQNPLFTARLGTGSVQFERLLNAAKTKRLQISYAFQRTTLTDLLIKNFIPIDDENVRSSMVSASYIEDTRDKPLDAHRGLFETVNFGVSPRAFGSTDSFDRFYGQFAFYRQVKPWVVWANSVRLGLVDSFGGSHVPISEKFFSGGADSLRGFPLNGAGPQTLATLCTKSGDPSSCTYQITAPTGGLQLFILNTEGRFPIPIDFPSPINKNLGAVLFYDGGNVYRTIGFRGVLSNYSNTVGFGLRYQTPIGPIRLDIGHNLNPVPGLKATNLFVTLGQAF